MTTTAHLLSLNVSEIKEVLWKGKMVRTGIYKLPTIGKLPVKGVNIEGDDQADRSVHGGVNKAIYGYPYEHYEFWKQKYPDLQFTSGMFGENLTTTGILENETYIGDKLIIGTVELIIVQPRFPCYKLGIKFGTQKVIKQFTKAKKPGFYCKISKEGEMETGDDIYIEKNSDPKLTLVDLLEIGKDMSKEKLELILEEEHLPEGYRREAHKLLKN